MMLEASQKEIKSFTNLLRKKLKEGGCHQAYINSLSDAQLLDDFRMCCDCGDEIYTRDQQLRMILESDTAERAYDLLYGVLEPEPEEQDQVDNLDWLWDESDMEFEDNDDEEIILRGKWIFDGAENINQAIQKLDNFKDYLQQLKDDKFELIDPINDDYGFLRRKQE